MVDNRNVFDGIKYAIRGQKCMLNFPRLWATAGIPLLFSALAYFILLAIFIFYRDNMQAVIEAYLAELPNWLQFIKKILASIFQIIMHLFASAVALIICGLTFWLTGKKFIHHSVLELEGEHIPLHNPDPLHLFFKTIGLLFCGALALTAMSMLMLLLAFLPFIGQFVAVVFISYSFCLIYISMLRSYRTINQQEKQNIYGSKLVLPAGFGFAAYVFFLIPIIGIFFMPGIFTGLILMLNSRRS